MKVRKADNSAMPTANGANSRGKPLPLGSASDGSNGACAASALVIPAWCDAESGRVRRCGLMHSYHIVAELRHFRGVSAREIRINRLVSKDLQLQRNAQFGRGLKASTANPRLIRCALRG